MTPLKFHLWLLGLMLLVGVGASQTPAWAQSPEPARPYKAWTVSVDGGVYLVDADIRVVQLDPVSLAPQARSQPLFPAASDRGAIFLQADETKLYVGNHRITQTLVLDRSDFRLLGSLDQAGPMALEPGRRLFLAPIYSSVGPDRTGSLFIYDLAHLDRPPQVLPIPCEKPSWAVVHTPQRRLYVKTTTLCNSTPHPDSHLLVYDLDTLDQLASLSWPFIHHYNRVSLADDADLMVDAPGGPAVRDEQGQERRPTRRRYAARSLAPAVIEPAGDWIYRLTDRALWTFRADDLSVQHVRPVTETFAHMTLAPDAETLYLFGQETLWAIPTAQLRAPGVEHVGTFPAEWVPRAGELRLYPSPAFSADGVALLQLAQVNGQGNEVYRTDDGGQTWQLLPQIARPEMYDPVIGPPFIKYLSFSPDFASDRTITARHGFYRLIRSSDGGDSWQQWAPRLAFASERDHNRELYTADLDGSNVSRLTDHPAADEKPAWSPAYTRIAFQSDRTGNWDIFTQRADCQSGPAAGCDLRQLTHSPGADMLPAWSPDGRSIAFVSDRDGNPEIYLIGSDGGQPRRLTRHPGRDWRPVWTPDSRQLIFSSDRGGDNDLYLMQFPDSSARSLRGAPLITPLVASPANDEMPAVSSTGHVFFVSDRDGGQRTYVYDPAQPDQEPAPFSQPPRPFKEGMPSVYGPNDLYVVFNPQGMTQIYRVDYSRHNRSIRSDYINVTFANAWSGDPAASIPWWEPDPALTMAWLARSNPELKRFLPAPSQSEPYPGWLRPPMRQALLP